MVRYYEPRRCSSKNRTWNTSVADIHQLHQTLDQLKFRSADIVHYLSDQVTYIKRLDHVAHISSDAIVNMSAVVKDFMIQSHDKFYEVTRDMMWINFTTHRAQYIWQLGN